MRDELKLSPCYSNILYQQSEYELLCSGCPEFFCLISEPLAKFLTYSMDTRHSHERFHHQNIVGRDKVGSPKMLYRWRYILAGIEPSANRNVKTIRFSWKGIYWLNAIPDRKRRRKHPLVANSTTRCRAYIVQSWKVISLNNINFPISVTQLAIYWMSRCTIII